MKLSVKIFFGVCIPAIIAIFIISVTVMDKNHQTYIEAETQSAIQSLKDVERNFESSTIIGGRDIVELMSHPYKNKNMDLIYYNDGNVEFASDENLISQDAQLINVEEDKYNVKIEELNETYYLLVSTKIDDKQYVLLAKNINSVFESRQELITNCIYVVAVSVVVIAIIAYIISKTLTKPLEVMKKEMLKLSKGDYDIHLKEGHNEFGKLAKNFNSMSKELEKRNNELIDSANSKQLFIDNLSHEMNTPLTSIQGYAELMEKANLSDEQKVKYLKYIQDESKRIQDMYKKLLLLSYKKNSDFEKSNVDMNRVFNEVNNMMKDKLNKAQIELIINSQLNSIYGDDTLIVMCISNLIKNAINVSNEGDKIIVNAFEMNGKKYIQVADQGSGISKENIKKITEPFYRVDKVRSRKNGGAGLGLSICKSIMEMHNGELKIESELGKGSIFILEFPA